MANNENRKSKGLVAQTTNLEKQTIKLVFTNNSVFNQCLKLHDYLFEYGRITTKQAQEK